MPTAPKGLGQMLAIEHSKMILDASHSLAAGVRELLVTEALERRKKKKAIKMLEGQPI